MTMAGEQSLTDRLPRKRDDDRHYAELMLRRRRAFDMRLAHASYRDIGEALDISPQLAHHDVQAVIAVLLPVELVEQVRQMEADRLDRWSQLAEAIAFADQALPATRLAALDRAKALAERRAKLLGLDAPVQVEHSGEVTIETTTDRELRTLVSEMRPDLARSRPDLA